MTFATRSPEPNPQKTRKPVRIRPLRPARCRRSHYRGYPSRPKLVRSVWRGNWYRWGRGRAKKVGAGKLFVTTTYPTADSDRVQRTKVSRTAPSPTFRYKRSVSSEIKQESGSDDGYAEGVDRFPGSSPHSEDSSLIVPMSMSKPAMDVFVERFVDAFSPEVTVKAGQASALRAAAGTRMFSPILTDAFEAVSVAFFGRSIQDKSVEAAGFRLYPRVLQGLQQALLDPERSKASQLW